MQRTLASALLAGMLVGCSPTPPTTTPDGAIPPEPERPSPRPQLEPSEESQALRLRYSQLESDLRTRGLLRTDGGGIDTPFDADTLVRNFVKVAMYDEFVPQSGRLVARETSSKLRRWEGPVRVETRFGAMVSQDQRDADNAAIANLARRLSAASDVDLKPVSSNGNFTVFVVNEDERRALDAPLRELVPGVSDTVLRTIRDMPVSTYCLVIAFSDDSAPEVYKRAIAIVRDEHPTLLRTSCFHEEITQGLGLANDSPQARPSIFNDDKEFALLTDHDAYLLRILYDPRLSPGMSSAEAIPIATQIAHEILPEDTASGTVDPDLKES